MNIYLYAYANRNFGDDIMIRRLCSTFPSHNFLLFASKHREVLDSLSDIPNLKPSPITLKQFSKCCRSDDVFLKIGGSMFIIKSRQTFINRTKELFYLKRIKKCGCKLASIGCNVGPFASPIHRQVAVSELALYDLITVRDKASYDFIKARTKCHHLELHPDILFALKDILPDNDQNDNSLCISVFKSGGNGCYNQKMAALADRYIEKNNGRVKLLVFESTENSDIISAGKIYSLATHKDKIDIITHRTGKEIINAVSSCGCMICTRFHSIVMAITAEKPFVPIVYSNKSQNLLEDLQYDGAIYSFDDMDSLDIDKALDALISDKAVSINTQASRLCSNAWLHFGALKHFFNAR